MNNQAQTNSTKRGPVGNLYAADDGERSAMLDQLRTIAALSKPWVLPPHGQMENQPLPENYQSMGSMGVSNLEGKMLVALFPPEQPWFELQPSAEERYRLRDDPDSLNELDAWLGFIELLAQAKLESVNIAVKLPRQSSFRSKKRQALSQLLVTGDVLERLDADYRLTVYRNDMYVTRRNNEGDVIYHVVREIIDPRTLDPQKFNVGAAQLPDELVNKELAKDRMVDMYTLVERQPLSGTWVIKQEVNGGVITKEGGSEEPISPYFSTAFELPPGENYGRGFVELNMGRLRTLDELERRLLDFAYIHSKQHPVLDMASMIRDEDLNQPSGRPIRGARVSGGQIQDMAWMAPSNTAQFQLVAEMVRSKTADLGRAMLLRTEVLPEKERVTAAQIRAEVSELDGALGGLYAPIADSQQIPLLQRTLWQMQRDMRIEKIGDDLAEIRAITGIAALGREIDLARLLGVVQLIGSLPSEEAQARIDYGVVVDRVVRLAGMNEPGVVKSRAQVEEELKQRQQAVIAQQAAEAAVTAAADVAAKQAQAQLATTGVANVA